jgi:hypothetical protein
VALYGSEADTEPPRDSRAIAAFEGQRSIEYLGDDGIECLVQRNLKH